MLSETPLTEAKAWYEANVVSRFGPSLACAHKEVTIAAYLAGRTAESYEMGAIKSYLLTTATFYRDEADDESKPDGDRLIAALKAKAIQDVLMGITKGKHKT